MARRRRDAREVLTVAAEALARYKLRTSLSVLGVILGVAAVIAMMSVSEGASREALQQVQLMGLDNVVARNRAGGSTGLVVSDADALLQLVPLTSVATPLVERYASLSGRGPGSLTRVAGVRPNYQAVLRLTVDRGRFLAPSDEQSGARVCVVGAPLARALFGYRDAVGEHIRLDADYYEVVGVLTAPGADPQSVGTLAWRDLGQTVLVPLGTLLGRNLDIAPTQRVDEIWVQVADDARVVEVGQAIEQAISRLHGGARDTDIVIPRELLAQRYRTQRTFSVVVGSVAALALLVGGIGIMNIMLTSVVERTHEIGIRRTAGATRGDVTMQFLIESLLMTVSGGVIGMAAGVLVSRGITTYAGWKTYTSLSAVALAFFVSFAVGVVFGLYPAVKAAHLEPVDALRYE